MDSQVACTFFDTLDPIKKLIAVYFDKFSKRVTKEKNHSKTVAVMQFYLGLLMSNNIQYDLKKLITVALEFMINLDANKGMKV